MAKVIKTTFKLRRGLESAWIKANPILAEGEPGWTLDTHILKIGDGVTPWLDLEVVNSGAVQEDDIQKAVNKYLEEHPITIKTDATLSVAGQAADAKAVRENCVFSNECLILFAGDADDNIFT